LGFSHQQTRVNKGLQRHDKTTDKMAVFQFNKIVPKWVVFKTIFMPNCQKTYKKY